MRSVVSRCPRGVAARGFTLVEIMVAIAVVATASLMLMATLSSQQRMNALARERSIATNAVRAYVEVMRQQYPSKSSTDMSGLLYDTTTPVNYLPTIGVEASAVRDARGLVLKMTDETGSHWGPAAIGTAPNEWQWTDATMKTYMSGCPSSAGTVAGLNTSTTAQPTFPALTDLDSMGFVQLGGNTVVGRDLDGSGTFANTEPSGTPTHVAPSSQLFVPCQITLSWKSGSGGESSSVTTARRQRITIYAAFGPQH